MWRPPSSSYSAHRRAGPAGRVRRACEARWILVIEALLFCDRGPWLFSCSQTTSTSRRACASMACSLPYIPSLLEVCSGCPAYPLACHCCVCVLYYVFIVFMLAPVFSGACCLAPLLLGDDEHSTVSDASLTLAHAGEAIEFFGVVNFGWRRP